MTLDIDRIPVVVSTGQAVERQEIVSVLDMATRATEAALRDVPRLRDRIEEVSVVNMLTDAGPAPASRLARRLGLSPRRTEVTTVGGNSPQWLVSRAARAIAAGEIEAVVVAGAEAQRSARAQGQSQGQGARFIARAGTEGPDEPLEPDPVVGETRIGFGPAEMAAGIMAPVRVYAMFESVLARRAGRTFAQQRASLAPVMARFTEVAASHPYAWFPQARAPAELAQLGPDNRLVSEPYPKRMCAILAVDQGAAVVVTSLGAARRAGVEDRAVFCVAGADATDVWFPTARPDPGTSPAVAAATAAALDAAHLRTSDIGLFDFYSCFPCALQMTAAAVGIGLDDDRGLTVTGGLPYFGGPGNNYSLHAIATMVERLREHHGNGLVTALGWYATKHSVGIYSSDPPASFAIGDTSAAQHAIDGSAVEVAEVYEGPAHVVACTVALATSRSASAAPVIARTDDGRHVAAAAADDLDVTELAGRNLVGERIIVSGTPPRYHVAGS